DLVEVVPDRVGRNAGLVAVEVRLFCVEINGGGVNGINAVGAYPSVDRDLNVVMDDLEVILDWLSRRPLAVARSDGNLLRWFYCYSYNA
ncbi:MAG TPA: hypothetical protein VK662_05840, partial [Acidothermaceae bacterium]|nr:hypothetical protein [Acidothermaceae bacterium]